MDTSIVWKSGFSQYIKTSKDEKRNTIYCIHRSFRNEDFRVSELTS